MRLIVSILGILFLSVGVFGQAFDEDEPAPEKKSAPKAVVQEKKVEVTVPATPAQVSPATPAQTVPATPAQVSPATPAQTVPATPAQVSPATPAQAAPAAPAQTVPATPVQAIPATPAQSVPIAPAQSVPATPAQSVPATPAQAAPAAPAQAVPAAPVQAIPATPAKPAPMAPAQVVPAAPAVPAVPAVPAQAAPAAVPAVKPEAVKKMPVPAEADSTILTETVCAVTGTSIKVTEKTPSSEYHGVRYYFIDEARKKEFDKNQWKYSKDIVTCQVCGKQDKIRGRGRATFPDFAYEGRTYSFCSNSHKALFEANPMKYLNPDKLSLKTVLKQNKVPPKQQNVKPAATDTNKEK